MRPGEKTEDGLRGDMKLEVPGGGPRAWRQGWEGGAREGG